MALPVYGQTLGSTKGITWDLKAKKNITYYTYVYGAGFIKQKARVTTLSKSASSKPGYVTLRLEVSFNRQLPLNASQIKKICSGYRSDNVELNPHCCYIVADYQSGKCLMNQNDKGVTVNRASWAYSGSKTYKSGSQSVSIRNSSMYVVIEYPKTYKGMCIGVGGWSTPQESEADETFWSGTIPFWKSKGKYSTKKKVSHFMRVK
jgi:hypothetical protein